MIKISYCKKKIIVAAWSKIDLLPKYLCPTAFINTQISGNVPINTKKNCIECAIAVFYQSAKTRQVVLSNFIRVKLKLATLSRVEKHSECTLIEKRKEN